MKKSLHTRLIGAVHQLAMRLLGQSVALKSLLYRIWWLFPESMREQTPVRTALKSLAQRGEPVFFLNIGANDGLAGDPVREFIVTRGWHGILVEPVNYVFQRLEKAYAAYPPPRIVLENAAIAETTGTMPFWHLKKADDMPPGYDQIGSFNKEHVLKHESMFPGLRKYLISEDVPCITVKDLLRKHRVARLDLVFIDTEGFDFAVIKQLDFDRLKPKAIIFESSHLGEAEALACRAFLEARGYALYPAGGDTIAWLASELPNFRG